VHKYAIAEAAAAAAINNDGTSFMRKDVFLWPKK
jgi:hypothetical protein